jgi:hypothetical protein
MSPWIALPLLACAALALAGCPLVSDQPLSDPEAARVDPALLGAWNTKDEETGESRTLTFLPFDEHELVGFAPGDSEGAVDAFRAFVTPIETERFLNVQELGSGSPGWFLMRYRVEADRLVLSVIDDGLFEGRQFASPQELQRFVSDHLADPRLYAVAGEEGEDMVWER